MGASRKKEIYDICVEFGTQYSSPTANLPSPICFTDIIIVEDDPYFFLQEGIYTPKSQRVSVRETKRADEEAAFIAGLAPSYVK